MKFNASKSILILGALAMIISSCHRQNELEGRWVGCEIRKPCIDWILNIRGNKFHLFREDSITWYKGHILLNSNCALKKIDLQINEAHTPSQNGKTILGIYEISSNILTIVVGQPGKLTRPLPLDEPRGEIVFNFERS